MTILGEELSQLMADSAQNAIETTQKEFDIILDGSPASIALVDDAILKFIEKYKELALEDKAVFTICNLFGAYIGEVFKQRVGGQWHYDESDPQAPYTVISYADKEYAFAGICYQRLVNDSQISVKEYFDKAVDNATQ